jgi:hypothetical protein
MKSSPKARPERYRFASEISDLRGIAVEQARLDAISGFELRHVIAGFRVQVCRS